MLCAMISSIWNLVTYISLVEFQKSVGGQFDGMRQVRDEEVDNFVFNFIVKGNKKHRVEEIHYF